MVRCACAQNSDGTTTTILCPVHADADPCETRAASTGRRRKGKVRDGVCTHCSWGHPDHKKRGMTMHDDPRPAPTPEPQDWLDDAANFADADEVVVRLASDRMTTDLRLTGAQVATMFRALAASEANGDDDTLKRTNPQEQ